ncbi:MAG: hypothetical protein MJZ12_00070 [Prevotella sp.]|nr:hypothetical protein [Prevotella sp.]
MTLREAIAVCKDMQEWRRYDGDEPKLMPWTPEKFGEAIDVLIDLAERQVEMEDDIRRFKDKLKKTAEE